MKEQGGNGAGCALIVIAALIGTAILIVAYAPWLLLAIPAAIVMAAIAVIFLADVVSDDVMVACEEPGGYEAWRISMLNPVRQAFHKPPLLQVPKLRVTYEERQLVKQASKLASGIAASLRNNSTAGADRAQLLAQANELPANMAGALWRLDRLRKMERAIDVRISRGQQTRDEMVALEKQIVAEMQRSLETLSAIPLSLMKVEVAQVERPTDRLLSSLSEANQHLRDISSAYNELHGTQGGS